MLSACLPFFAPKKKSKEIARINPLRCIDLFDRLMLNCQDDRRYINYHLAFIAALESHRTYLLRVDTPADKAELKAAELHYSDELIRVLKADVDLETLQQILNRTFISLDRYCLQKKLKSQIRDCIASLAESPALLAGFGLTHIIPKEPGDDEYSLLLTYHVNCARYQGSVERAGKTHFMHSKFHGALSLTLAQHRQHLQQGILQLEHKTSALKKCRNRFFTDPGLETSITAAEEKTTCLKKEKTLTEELTKKLADHFEVSIGSVPLDTFILELLPSSFELAKLARHLDGCDGFAEIYGYDRTQSWMSKIPDWDFALGVPSTRGDSTDSDLSATVSTYSSSRSACSV